MRSFSTDRQAAVALVLISSIFSSPLAGNAAKANQASTPSTFAASTNTTKATVTVAQSVVPAAPADAGNPYGLNPQEAQFVDLVNHERTSRGLSALTVDPTLVQIARSHSEEMCKLSYFDHHSPTPGITTPMDRYLKALKDANLSTPAYLLVGENIYYCSVLNSHYNVAFGHQSLMNSPGHRANILEPRFEKIGVGTYRDAKGEFWVTESFMCDDEPQTASATPTN